MPDLYSLDSPLGGWRRACGGNTGDAGTDESCVEVAPIPLHPDSYALRDSKAPSRGELRFTRDELDAFAESWPKAFGA